MSNHQKRAVDRETAEQILNGDPATRTGHARLDGLLSAAAAPASARETAGEDAAVAAFLAARLASPPEPRRNSPGKSALAKLLTVKVAAACLAVSGAGGVALAASTGALPSPLHKPAAHHSADPSPSALPQPSGRSSRHPGLSAPPAELLKLCQRYAAHPDGARLGDLDRPEFGKLVEGAGRKDRDRVDRFCDRVLEPNASGTPSDYLNDPGDPGDPGEFDDDSDSDDLPSGDPPTRPSGQAGAGASHKPGPRSGSLPNDMPVSPSSGW